MMRALSTLALILVTAAAVWAANVPTPVAPPPVAPITPAAARGQAADLLGTMPPALKQTLQASPIVPATARTQATDAVANLCTLYQNQADASFHTGDWDRTRQALDRIIALNPKGTEPYALAAWLLWSSGKNNEAVDYYNRMIVANPKDPEAYFEYGFYYVMQKNDAEAVKWLQTAVTLGIKSPERRMYGHALTRLGRTTEALDFWRTVLADDPKDDIAQGEIAKLTHSATVPDAAAPAEIAPATPPGVLPPAKSNAKW